MASDSFAIITQLESQHSFIAVSQATGESLALDRQNTFKGLRDSDPVIRVVYEMPLLDRRVSPDSDTPRKARYRIYEHILLDQRFGGERVSPEFASKNILIWQPHIHFM